jgi:hypothetical protein
MATVVSGEILDDITLNIQEEALGGRGGGGGGGGDGGLVRSSGRAWRMLRVGHYTGAKAKAWCLLINARASLPLTARHVM